MSVAPARWLRHTDATLAAIRREVEAGDWLSRDDAVRLLDEIVYLRARCLGLGRANNRLHTRLWKARRDRDRKQFHADKSHKFGLLLAHLHELEKRNAELRDENRRLGRTEDPGWAACRERMERLP